MAQSNHPRRRVLVLAYYFPPMGSSGVQRTGKFVKYLQRYGWQPTVLTVEPYGYIAKDESLLAELTPLDICIARTPPAGPSRLLSRREIVRLPAERTRRVLSMLSDTVFIPDNKIGWRRRAVEMAARLHAETPFDLIFATAPPFTSFLIGRDLRARLKKPLVLDYRDPWLEYPFKFYPTPLHRWAHATLERRCLRASGHVVTTNRRVKELILTRHRFLTYHEISIIPQGYDEEDFERVKFEEQAAEGARKKSAGSKRIRITYAGIFMEDRVPDHFLQALHDLYAESPKLRGRFECVFVGTVRPEHQRLVERLGLQDSVTMTGYLPHRECVRELLRSDVLWMVVGDDVGSPGKTYEYIGARKPILALAPDGFIKQAVLEAGGVVVPPTDVPAIARALAEFHEKFEHHQLSGPSEEVVCKYSRERLTGDLVKVFESLIEP